ncbi:MAG TPA: GNAT family N-acetyltransferase [Solirubrobacterales bacterium]|nr:GNAT family N-acetyltransferase [Solirubrobacterales bacterium]
MASKQLREGIGIRDARLDDVEDLLPLMRAYADFYESNPPDEGLREMARALIEDPDEGALFIARDGAGAAIGFAAMDWKWSSTRGSRVGYLEDLFVDPEARGGGTADALIGVCAERCRERGVPALLWMTAPDNERARRVYDRVGGVPGTWIEYDLELE